MDKIVKNDSLCYQILFNKPLLKERGKYIYGFRIKYNELKHKPISEKQLMKYIVEAIFGKCLFKMIHDGSFDEENDKIWIDKDGNEYNGYGVQTRQYSYDATMEYMLNYRCDLIYAPCESENDEHYWITDPDEYFNEKAKFDSDDHKLGKNQWMENYLRIKSRREVLSMVTPNRSENLDYDIQELIKEEWADVKIGCRNFFREEGYSVDDEGHSDELPF